MNAVVTSDKLKIGEMERIDNSMKQIQFHHPKMKKELRFNARTHTHRDPNSGPVVSYFTIIQCMGLC